MGANGEGKKIPNFLEPGTDGTRGRGGRARMEEEGTHPLPLHVWGRERGHGTLRAPSGASFHSHGVSQSVEEWLWHLESFERSFGRPMSLLIWYRNFKPA